MPLFRGGTARPFSMIVANKKMGAEAPEVHINRVALINLLCLSYLIQGNGGLSGPMKSRILQYLPDTAHWKSLPSFQSPNTWAIFL